MGMRLGEGSGAALAMPIVEAACAMYNNMGSLPPVTLCFRMVRKHSFGHAEPRPWCNTVQLSLYGNVLL